MGLVSSEIDHDQALEPIICAVAVATSGFKKVENPFKSDLKGVPDNLIFAETGIAPSDAGVEAAKGVFSELSIAIDHVDLLISCTQTPDLNNPSLASTILYKLGSKRIPGLEIRQSVAGMHYAIDLASKLIRLREKRCVLVVAAEFLSRFYGGYQESKVLTDSQLAMRARSSDGASAFIISTKHYLAQHGANLQRHANVNYIFAGASPKEWSSFAALLPSSSQFPLRLSKDDVLRGKQLPYINGEKFIEASHQLLSDVIKIDSIASLIHKDCKINIHAPVAASNYASLFHNIDCLTDIYMQDGYLSAAGVGRQMRECFESDCRNSEKKIFIGIGSGIQVGFLVISFK